MVENVIGKTLRLGEETVATQDLMEKSGMPELLGIYFGAHWAPPCRLFTPALIEFYQNVNDKGKKKIEIVFCSNDGNEAHFERNFATMPFPAIPFSDEQRIQNLK